MIDPARRLAAEAEWSRVTASTALGAEAGGFGQVYEAAGRRGTWFGDWNAQLGSADRDYIPARNGVVARTRDILRNDPVAPAAISRRKNAAIGRGWRLSSKPDFRALGITFEASRELGQQIQTEFRHHAYGHNFSSDAERRLTFGQQLRVTASHLMMDGEFLGLVEWAPDEPTRYKTRLRLIDPDRLSNPLGRLDDDFLRGGVERNRAGIPIRYWIRERHPADLGLSSLSLVWTPFDRFATPLGRPQVLHGFDPERAGQTRGVTRFAAVLKSFRALSKFTDATLQNATINALMVGFIQSSAGPEALKEGFGVEDLARFEGDRGEFYDENPIRIGDAIMPALPLGDEVKMATAGRNVTGFDAFVRAIIRLIASSLGVTYEEVSMDYSQTNYSSARAAMLHAWNETVAFCGVIEDQLVRPYFVAWLEEAFDAGYLEIPAGAPDFYDAVDAYAQARWIGPGRGHIDPTKEVLAAAARIEAGISTLEDECAVYDGSDYEDKMEQQAREQARRVELGLQPTAIAEAQAIEDTKNPARGAQSPTDIEGQPDPGAPKSEAPPPGHPKASAHRPALAQLAAFAETAEHAAFLDARPLAVV